MVFELRKGSSVVSYDDAMSANKKWTFCDKEQLQALDFRLRHAEMHNQIAVAHVSTAADMPPPHAPPTIDTSAIAAIPVAAPTPNSQQEDQDYQGSKASEAMQD